MPLPIDASEGRPSTPGISKRDAICRLWSTPGIGPALGRRLLEAFDEPAGIFRASISQLTSIHGIGEGTARKLFDALDRSEATRDVELAEAKRFGAQVVTLGEPGYPPLLAEVPDAPLVLWYRGSLPAQRTDYTVAIVGSRRCTPYGVEQAERFAGALAQSGLIVVSGGARGVDSAAHRAAIRMSGRTLAVLGCGLAHCYPPENAELFDQIVDQGGAILSELPMRTAPVAANFPARNRIIAAMSLGILVIEAPKASGALITARLATENYGREVMAVPGRIDSASSQGSNELIQSGSAGLISEPRDVLDALTDAARHLHIGTHAVRYASDQTGEGMPDVAGDDLRASEPIEGLSEIQRTIVDSLSEPGTLDDICRRTGLDAHEVNAETTVLEIRRLVSRQGGGVLART